MRQPLVAAMILLAGSLLAGLGFCALLPPFEGFDETAHYSYIQQIAQTGTWPRQNNTFSAEVDDYLKIAPSQGALKSRWSYSTFFSASTDTLRAGAAAAHAARDPSRSWHPQARHNWEGQHPPMYYALLAPVWSMSKGWSLYAQLVLLRSTSYLLAFSGLVVATFSIVRRYGNHPTNALLIVAPALWPALFPMWFPEMARLGNDSLVLLLIALALPVTQRAVSSQGTFLHFGLLGVLCGLGLLTKATFLPFVAALGLFLTWRVWRARDVAAMLRKSIYQMLVFCLVVAAIASWWYVENLLATGSLVGSHDAVLIHQQGGLFKGLSEKFSLPNAVRGLSATAMTFLWVGTWSMILPPRTTMVPLSILFILIAAGWTWRTARTKQISSIDAIAIITLVLFIAALLWMTLVFIASYAVYSAGAWYLHSLAPLLAPMVALGLAEITGYYRLRPFVSALVIYPLLFLPFATGVELIYFSGCIGEPAGDRHFSMANIITCYLTPSTIMKHLEMLGNPTVAISLFGSGCVLLLIGVAIIIANRFFAPACQMSASGAGGRSGPQ